jgi:hypothetical protein
VCESEAEVENYTTLSRLGSHEYLIHRGVGELLFPRPCQRPEGTLAGESRSSRPRAGAEAVTPLVFSFR